MKKPGVVQAPAGVTVRELIDDYCGGMLDGHEFTAYLPGGASGGILPASMGDIPLDFGGELAKVGAFVGSHAVVVFSDHDDVKDAVVNLLKFFKHESCGQCTPCREGTDKMVTLLEGQGRIERAGAARPRNGHARLVDLRPRPGGAESGEPSADAVPEGLLR